MLRRLLLLGLLVGSLAGSQGHVRGQELDAAQPAPQQVNTLDGVTTRSFNNSRTGANLQETILTPQNVNGSTFGKLFSRTVDGQVYAQPLYLSNLSIGGVVRNVLFVATAKNHVYAFDADDPAASAPLWDVQLGAYGVSSEQEFGTRYNGGVYQDIKPYVGIIGTPVIDPAAGTLYLVTFVKDGTLQYHHDLVALDIRTGQQRTNSPRRIEVQMPGGGAGSSNGVLTFDSRFQLQRAALLLDHGIVYVAFAGFSDTNPYHGWLLGYNATTLSLVKIFNASPDLLDSEDPNDGEAGIWMSGNGPSSDGSGIYIVTGNGNWNADSGHNYGSSAVRLNATGVFTVSTWFTPYNYDALNENDTDVGTTAGVLIPGTQLMIFGSKAGKIYVVNKNSMGGLGVQDPNNSGYDTPIPGQFYQSFKTHNSNFPALLGSPVVWDGGTLGQRMYVWPLGGPVRGFQLTGTSFNTTAVATSTVGGQPWPGGILALSANGSDASSGIVWGVHGLAGSANTTTRPGQLHAFRADTLQELWNSDQNVARDSLGNFGKFNPPLIANGKVYMADFSDATPNSDEIQVYGLLAPSIIALSDDVALVGSQSATLQVRATGAATLSYQWYRGSSGDTSDPVAGGTAAELSVLTPADTAMYWVRVSNSYGHVDSASVTVQRLWQMLLPLLRK